MPLSYASSFSTAGSALIRRLHPFAQLLSASPRDQPVLARRLVETTIILDFQVFTKIHDVVTLTAYPELLQADLKQSF
jgi:hypothetical protein